VIASDRRISLGWRLPILGLVALAVLFAAPTAAPAALGDNFAGAEVEGNNGSDWGEYFWAKLSAATKEPGEPDHAGEVGGHSVWMGWRTHEDQVIQASVCADEDVDPLLAVYTGTAVDQLTEVGSDGVPEDDCDGDVNWVRFAAKAGTTYWIAVDAKGNPGSVGLHVDRVAPNDNFTDALVLDPLPLHAWTDTSIATSEPGEPDHSGHGSNNSVWYEWTPTIDGHADFGGCDYWDGGRVAVYKGSAVGSLTHLATGTLGEPACRAEKMAQFEARRGTTYMIAIVGGNGKDGDLDLYFGFTFPPRALSIPPQPLGPFGFPGPLATAPADKHRRPKCRKQSRRAATHRAKPCARKKHRGKRHSHHA